MTRKPTLFVLPNMQRGSHVRADDGGIEIAPLPWPLLSRAPHRFASGPRMLNLECEHNTNETDGLRAIPQ